MFYSSPCERKKMNIFKSHYARDAMRQLAAIETPARGLRILSNLRILGKKKILLCKKLELSL